MKILLLGMNHRSASLEVRERFALSDPGPLLQKLVDCDEIEEAVIVSTCNRVELVVATRSIDAARHRMVRFFSRELGGGAPLPDGRPLTDFTYEYRDSEAMCHVFRVASAIDSMVVGESQILGQLKDAYRQAIDLGTCGPILSRLFQHAFATAKRVKNETRISERPTSIARVAVELAKQIFEDLSDKTALLVGAGEMIEMALFALQREGLGNQLVANRSLRNAEELAQRFDAIPHGLADLEFLLAKADVVLTCVGGEAPLLTHAMVHAALRQRRNHPIFIIDIGVPRNVAPEVESLDSVYVYDIDDLNGIAEVNAQQRRRESERGEDIVREEQQRFDGWLVALRAVPTIRDLRTHAETIRSREFTRQLSRLKLDPEQRAAVEQLTHGLVNKILHAPLSRLRAETDHDSGLAMLEAARALFGLDDGSAPSAQSDPPRSVGEPYPFSNNAGEDVDEESP